MKKFVRKSLKSGSLWHHSASLSSLTIVSRVSFCMFGICALSFTVFFYRVSFVFVHLFIFLVLSVLFFLFLSHLFMKKNASPIVASTSIIPNACGVKNADTSASGVVFSCGSIPSVRDTDFSSSSSLPNTLLAPIIKNTTSAIFNTNMIDGCCSIFSMLDVSMPVGVMQKNIRNIIATPTSAISGNA